MIYNISEVQINSVTDIAMHDITGGYIVECIPYEGATFECTLPFGWAPPKLDNKGEGETSPDIHDADHDVEIFLNQFRKE